MTTILLIYFVIVNIVLLFDMGADKKFARENRNRIPERTLFLFAVLGGAAGGTLGMMLFHHKTRKPIFRYGFPVLACFWLVIWIFLLANT